LLLWKKVREHSREHQITESASAAGGKTHLVHRMERTQQTPTCVIDEER